MDPRKQILINSVISFLQNEINSNTLDEDRKESLEVAIQCLETAFEVDSQNPEAKQVANVDLLSYISTRPKREVTEEQKLQAEEHKNKGNTFMRESDYQSAVAEYSKAIELNPYIAIYYCNRAAAYTRLEKDYEAIEDCNEAIKLDPTYGKAYGRLGIAYSNLNKYDLAEKAYETALKYDPNNPLYESNLKLAQERVVANLEPAAPPQHRPIDISQFINNPNIINMATQMLNDPNFCNIMSGLMSMGQSGEVNMEALFEAGQTLANRMQSTDANFVESLRRNIEAQSSQSQNNTSQNTEPKSGNDKKNE